MRIEKFKGVLLSTLVITSVVVLALSLSSSGSASEPSNQPPMANFNFSPEQPRAGETVYFFDSSYDPDGHIVGWYWAYAPNFGGEYWTFPMPFDYGEQDKQNPTLTFEFGGGGYPKKVQINLRVTDDDGAVDYVSRIIYIYWVPCLPPNLDWVRLEAISTEGNSYVKVEITFPDPCYDVDWGSVTRIDDSTFSADAEIWEWTGFCVGVVGEFEKSHVYDLGDLGALPPGIYEFIFKAWGTPIKSLQFAHSLGLENALKLVTLYKVNLDVDLWLETNSKLVVKFYTWGDDFEGESVVWNGPAPDNVILLEDIPHPQGKAVEKARLDLTHDNTENVIETIASFTVCKGDLENRFKEIPRYWIGAPPEGKEELENEFKKIPRYWLAAPSREYVLGDKPSGEALTLQELLEDFDENILGFKSYDPGDVVQVRDTVENTMLVSEHHWWENTMFYPYENIIENTYNASYPITLIVVESCAENIWEDPLSELGGGKVIGCEGDRRDDFEIGEEVTVFINIEKSDNIEIARELVLGSLLWDLLYWID